MLHLLEPGDIPGVRVDSGLAVGTEIGSDYDPMLSKVIAHGADRASALRLLDRALANTAVLGVVTNLDFLRFTLADPTWSQAAWTPACWTAGSATSLPRHRPTTC